MLPNGVSAPPNQQETGQQLTAVEQSRAAGELAQNRTSRLRNDRCPCREPRAGERGLRLLDERRGQSDHADLAGPARLERACKLWPESRPTILTCCSRSLGKFYLSLLSEDRKQGRADANSRTQQLVVWCGTMESGGAEWAHGKNARAAKCQGAEHRMQEIHEGEIDRYPWQIKQRRGTLAPEEAAYGIDVSSAFQCLRSREAEARHVDGYTMPPRVS